MDPETSSTAKRPRRKTKQGPRGGTTTLSADGTRRRKSFFVEEKFIQALRREAFERELRETDIIREMFEERYPDASD